jgi:hypothetical protein
MKESDMPKADLVTGIVLFAFSIGVIVLSSQMPTYSEMGRNPYSAPGLVPTLLGIVIGSLSLVLIIRSIRRGGYRLGLTAQNVSGFFRKGPTVRVLVTLVWSVVYAFILIGRMHYAIATGIFVFGFIAYFEYERRKTVREHLRSFGFGLLEAVLVAVIVSGVFQYLFLVTLP